MVGTQRDCINMGDANAGDCFDFPESPNIKGRFCLCATDNCNSGPLPPPLN